LALIVGLFAEPAKAQASLTVFSAASKFCEKTQLGVEPIAAYEQALDYVAGNRFFDRDY